MTKCYINNKFFDIDEDKVVVYENYDDVTAYELFISTSKKDIRGISYPIDERFIKITEDFISIYNNDEELVYSFQKSPYELKSFNTMILLNKNIKDADEYIVEDKIFKINQDYLAIYKDNKIQDIYILYDDDDFPNADIKDNDIYRKHDFYLQNDPVYDRLSFNYIHKDLDLFTKKNHTITIEGYFLGFFETKYFSFPNTTFLELLLHLNHKHISEIIDEGEDKEYYLNRFKIDGIWDYNNSKVITLSYYLAQVGLSPSYINVYQN